jgi:hypothetical protein
MVTHAPASRWASVDPGGYGVDAPPTPGDAGPLEFNRRGRSADDDLISQPTPRQELKRCAKRELFRIPAAYLAPDDHNLIRFLDREVANSIARQVPHTILNLLREASVVSQLAPKHSE